MTAGALLRSHIGKVDGDCAMAVMDVAMASKMVMIAFFIFVVIVC